MLIGETSKTTKLYLLPLQIERFICKLINAFLGDRGGGGGALTFLHLAGWVFIYLFMNPVSKWYFKSPSSTSRSIEEAVKCTQLNSTNYFVRSLN